MKYINAHIPRHLLLLPFFLILLPAWTHEGRKSGEAYLKGKQESPWGSRIKKGEERNGEERSAGRGGGVLGVEVDLDSAAETRRAGMNINNTLYWKNSHNGHHRVMKRANGSKFHSRPYSERACVCVCAGAQEWSFVCA